MPLAPMKAGDHDENRIFLLETQPLPRCRTGTLGNSKACNINSVRDDRDFVWRNPFSSLEEPGIRLTDRNVSRNEGCRRSVYDVIGFPAGTPGLGAMEGLEDGRYSARPCQGTRKHAAPEHMGVHNIKASAPQELRELNRRSDVLGARKRQCGYRDILRDCGPESLVKDRVADQVGAKRLAGQSAQQTTNVFLHSTPKRGIGEVQDGMAVIAQGLYSATRSAVIGIPPHSSHAGMTGAGTDFLVRRRMRGMAAASATITQNGF